MMRKSQNTHYQFFVEVLYKRTLLYKEQLAPCNENVRQVHGNNGNRENLKM